MGNQLNKLDDSSLDCPRCEATMKDCGILGFLKHSGAALPLWRISANSVELQTYACPSCGKVEFFL